jgi:protein TonB
VEDIEINAEMDQNEVVEEYVPVEVEEEEVVEAEVFTIVEQMPSFPGGDAKMYEYLGKNIKYPQIARETGIQGRVFVNFVVEPDGSVSNVKVLRGIGGGCDEEAMRVVKGMPKWSPGKQRGKTVRVSYTLPVVFKLQG